MSFYLKYRPQTIAELDLTLVRESLSRILVSGSYSHAYLFSGPKGTGKTSSARILAKVLNCEKNRGQLDREIVRSSDSFGKKPEQTIKQSNDQTNKRLVEPCNECDICLRITHGSSLACMEMDAASNRGIDDIRTLRERVGLAPAEGSFSIYIIDEVHMLTTEAFNALLKTLEEPPDHAIFMLCTTDPQKIPDTVISRCTRVPFLKANSTEVIRSLTKAVTGETLDVEEGVVEMIADRVDGSFRDGMKTLEQLAQSGGKITKDKVDELTGFGGDYAAHDLVDFLLKKDVQKALKEIRQKQEAGIDVGVFARRLVERLRHLLLEAVRKNSAEAQPLVQLTKSMSEAATKVRSSVLPMLPLEIAVTEWCLTTHVVGGSTKLEVPNIKEDPENSESPHSAKATRGRQEVRDPERVVEEPKKNEVEEKKGEENTGVQDKKEPVRQDAFAGTLADVTSKWKEILIALRPLNHSLEALLRSARPAHFEDGWLTVEAYYKFHKEQLEQERYRKKLEETMSQILGGSVYLKFALGKPVKMANHPVVDNISGMVEDDALVKAAEEIFGS